MWMLQPFFLCKHDSARSACLIDRPVQVLAVPLGDSFRYCLRSSLAGFAVLSEDLKNFLLQMGEIEVRQEPSSVCALPRLCDRDHVLQSLGGLDSLVDSVTVFALCLRGSTKAGGCGSLHGEFNFLPASGPELPQIVRRHGSCRQDTCCRLSEFEGGGEERVLPAYRYL